MATYTEISLGSIRTEHLVRYRDYLSAHFGYRDVDMNGDQNTETKTDYVRRKTRQQLMLWVQRQEYKEATDALDIPPIDMID